MYISLKKTSDLYPSNSTHINLRKQTKATQVNSCKYLIIQIQTEQYFKIHNFLSHNKSKGIL